MRHEQLGKFRFVMERTNPVRGLIEPHYFGYCNRGHRRNATRLAGRQPSPKKSPFSWRATTASLPFSESLGKFGELLS